MLCDFKFKKEIQHFPPSTASDEVNKNQNSEYSESEISKPSILEIVIGIWVFTLFCEEIRQVFLRFYE